MTKCVTQGHEVSKRCQKMVPIDLLQAGRNKPSICKKKKKKKKKGISVKHNKVKCNKTKHVYDLQTYLYKHIWLSHLDGHLITEYP